MSQSFYQVCTSILRKLSTNNVEHPGGPKIILKYAGKDATEEYEPIHPPDTLDKYLPKEKHLGPVNMDTVEKEEKEETPEEKARQERLKMMPPARGMLQPDGFRVSGSRSHEKARLGILLFRRRR